MTTNAVNLQQVYETVEERRTPTGVPTVTFLCSYCSHSFSQKGNAQRHVCKTHFKHDMTCQHCNIIYYDEILIVNPICPTCSVEKKETNSNRHYRLNGAAKTSHGSRKETFRKRSRQDESDSEGDCVIERDFNEDSLGFKSEEATDHAIFIAGTSTSTCLTVEKRKDRQNVRLRAPTHEAVKLCTETTPVTTNLIKLKSSSTVVRSGSNTIAMKHEDTISNADHASYSEIDDSVNISQASTSKDGPVQSESEPLFENDKSLSSVAEPSQLVEISTSLGSTSNTIEKDPVSFTTVQATCNSNGVQNKFSSTEDINIVVRNKYPNFDLKRTLSVSVALKRVSVTRSHLNGGIKAKTVEDTLLKPNQDKPKRIIKKPKLSEFLTGDEVDIVNVRATAVRQGPKSPQKQKSTSPTKSAVATRRKVNSKGLSGGQGLIVPETLTLSIAPTTTPVKDSPLRQRQLLGSTPKNAKSKQIGPRPGTAHSPDITSFGTTSNVFSTGGKKKPGRPRKILVAKLTLTDVPQSQPGVSHELPPAHAGNADCNLMPESSVPVTDPSVLAHFKDSSITQNLPQPTETTNGIADYLASEAAVEIPTTPVGEFGCPRCAQRFESNAEAKMHQLVNHDGSSTETIHLGFADVHENYLPLEPVTESSGLLTMSASSEPLITTSSKPEQERTLQSIYSSPFKNTNSLTESSNILVPRISTSMSSNTDGGIPLIRNYERLESSDPGNAPHNANEDGISRSTGNSTASSIPTISATPTSALESTVTSFSSLSDVGSNLGSRVKVGDRSSLMSTELPTEMTGPSIPLPLAASLNSFGSGSSLHFANTVHTTMESLMDINRYQEVAPMTSGAVAVPVVIDATCEEPYNANGFITYATGEAEESRYPPNFEVEMEEKVLVMPRDPNFVVWEGFCPDTSFSETRSLGIMRLGRDGIEKLPHNTQSLENS